MISFDEIRLMAYNKQPPTGLNSIERAAYTQMFFIYLAFENKLISKDIAEEQVSEARQQYEKDLLLFRMYDVGARRQRAAAKIGLEIETEGCPICRKMMKIMDGRAPISRDFEITSEYNPQSPEFCRQE